MFVTRAPYAKRPNRSAESPQSVFGVESPRNCREIRGDRENQLHNLREVRLDRDRSSQTKVGHSNSFVVLLEWLVWTRCHAEIRCADDSGCDDDKSETNCPPVLKALQVREHSKCKAELS